MNILYQTLLDNIPKYENFLTLAELDASSYALAANYPDLVEVFSIGKSRRGHDLLCIKIKGGDKNALAFGLPHPNEPIGTATLEYFMQALAENQALREDLGYTWYFVKAYDPDGYQLNEGWIKGPFTLENYSRHFFRPVEWEQVDTTYPVDYKEYHFHNTLPETAAMKKLIDDIRPEFIYSLHNSTFGGAFWYLSNPMPSIYSDLHRAANRMGVPLHLGEPEMASCTVWAPAIFETPTTSQTYEYIAQHTNRELSKALRSGADSGEYALTHYNTCTLITELPYFITANIDDTSLSTVTRHQMALDSIAWEEESLGFIHRQISSIQNYITDCNPFWSPLQSFSKMDDYESKKIMISTNPDYERLATVAEEFGNRVINKFGALLCYGLLIRASQYELEKLTECEQEHLQKKDALTAVISATEQLHKQISAFVEQEMQCQVVPIQKLVSIQLESGLLVMETLKKYNKNSL